MTAAFLAAKDRLLQATDLAFPLQGARLALATEAGASHGGAALQQWSPEQVAWQPLGFFSEKLDMAQLNYSTFDRELFAIFPGRTPPGTT